MRRFAGRAKRSVACSVAALLLVVGSGRPAAAQDEPAHYLEDLGWGLAAIGSNLVYVPVKLVYAVAGGVVGGLAYALSGGSPEAAQLVWSPSLGGAYVLTPAMLQGQEPVFFSGEQYEAELEEEELDRPIRDEPIGED